MTTPPGKKPPLFPGQLNRRDAVKLLAAMAGYATLTACVGTRVANTIARAPGSSSGSPQPPPATGSRRRLAVIGGGMGGLATAWLCDASWKVDLFEERHKLGGHCDSETIDFNGHPLTVDVGAQFFHPDTHPIYLCLLEELGLYDAADPEHDQTIAAKGSLSILPLDGSRPYFTSTHPLETPVRAIDFAIYAKAARRLVAEDGPVELTLEDWLGSLKVTPDFRRRILYPWISSMIGCTIEEARGTTARSIFQTFALAFPRNLLKGATTWNSRIGLQGNLMKMAERCGNLEVHRQAAVGRLEKSGQEWFVHTAGGRHGPFDAVVINAPPRVSRTWVKALPWATDLAKLLDRYHYFDSRLVIHTDPVYVHAKRKYWTAYNVGVEAGSAEASVWLGGIHEKIGGRPVDVFKSWASRRSREPSNVLLSRSFLHPLITPDTIRAARELKRWQGREGLWFAGQHTTGTDLQDSALYSAMCVARALAPESPNLAALTTRLAAKGLEGFGYDL